MLFKNVEKWESINICRPTYIKKSGLVPYCTNLYSKRLNIICHRRASMLKCCHTGFEHAHNCHKVN